MKTVLVLVGLLSLASIGLAADIAKDPLVAVEGSYAPRSDLVSRGNMAVVSLFEGVFTDVSAYYLAGLSAAGHTVDHLTDPGGTADYSAYSLLVVLSSDNWWGSAFGAEALALAAYMDGGGHVIVIGQDWLFGIDELGFAVSYLGLEGRTHDLNVNDPGDLEWTGTSGGPLDGNSGSLSVCFDANNWYTDLIEPASQGLVTWSSPMAPTPQEGGCVGERGILSTVEFSCGSYDVIGDFLTWHLTTPTAPSSFSDVKSRY